MLSIWQLIIWSWVTLVGSVLAWRLCEAVQDFIKEKSKSVQTEREIAALERLLPHLDDAEKSSLVTKYLKRLTEVQKPINNSEGENRQKKRWRFPRLNIRKGLAGRP